MKKGLSIFLTLLMLCASATAYAANGASVAAQQLVFNNPLPDIFERVSPSVAALVCVTNKWDAATDTVTKYEEGAGSAVYVDERGYFITNAHVVTDADELEIRLGDGTVFEAFTVGYDEATDVAVVQIFDKFPGKPVAIGSSSALRVGDLVCAIGSPLDEAVMYNTLNCGIVSGLNREDADPTSSRAIGLIQADIAINPGNSGGALLNDKGEMVGIPFMKYMGYYRHNEAGEEFVVYEGLSFAIPMDVAWPVAKSIIETGVYNRPRFGVSVLDIAGPEEPLKNYPPAGLQVQEVEANGSGARAGIRVGDVITHVNGNRVHNFREYTKYIDKLGAGEAFVITVARYNNEKGEKLQKPQIVELTVTLEMID